MAVASSQKASHALNYFSSTIQRHTEMYLHCDHPVGLHLERIDCAFNKWGYIHLPPGTFVYIKPRGLTFTMVKSSRCSLVGHLRSSVTSYLLHLYHTLAWRTCCVLILRTSHDVFDFTPLPLQDSGNDLWNLYVLPFTFLYQNHLEILRTKRVRVLAIGLEADLIVDTHPLFCFTRGKWSGGQGGRLGLRPLLGGLSAGRRLRPGLRDI